MTPFEEQVKRAMARQNPLPDFTGRVLAAVDAAHVQRPRAGWRRWARWVHNWRVAPVLAALLIMSGGVVHQERQRAARGEEVKEKLLVAMRIAGVKLQQARHRVFEVEANEAQQ